MSGVVFVFVSALFFDLGFCFVWWWPNCRASLPTRPDHCCIIAGDLRLSGYEVWCRWLEDEWTQFLVRAFGSSLVVFASRLAYLRQFTIP